MNHGPDRSMDYPNHPHHRSAHVMPTQWVIALAVGMWCHGALAGWLLRSDRRALTDLRIRVAELEAAMWEDDDPDPGDDVPVDEASNVVAIGRRVG